MLLLFKSTVTDAPPITSLGNFRGTQPPWQPIEIDYGQAIRADRMTSFARGQQRASGPLVEFSQIAHGWAGGTADLPAFPEFSYRILVRFELSRRRSFGLRPRAQARRRASGDFEHPLQAHMMAIDGAWRQVCAIRDTTLLVETSIKGLGLKEFFYRRCELDRVNGEELAVNLLRQKARKNNEGHLGPCLDQSRANFPCAMELFRCVHFVTSSL